VEAGDADVIEGAFTREVALWEAYRANDRRRLEALIHPDALDVGPAGSRDRDRVIAALARMEIRSYSIENFELRAFENLEVVSYLAVVDGTYEGEPFAASRVFASTVWMREGDSWRVVHRHESPSPS